MRAAGQGNTELEFPGGRWLAQLLEQSLSEDVGTGDVSTAVAVAPTTRARGRLVARAAGVVAGLPLLPMLFLILTSFTPLYFIRFLKNQNTLCWV